MATPYDPYWELPEHQPNTPILEIDLEKPFKIKGVNYIFFAKDANLSWKPDQINPGLVINAIMREYYE